MAEFKIGQYKIENQQYYQAILAANLGDNSTLAKLDTNNDKVLSEDELAVIDSNAINAEENAQQTAATTQQVVNTNGAVEQQQTANNGTQQLVTTDANGNVVQQQVATDGTQQAVVVNNGQTATTTTGTTFNADAYDTSSIEEQMQLLQESYEAKMEMYNAQLDKLSKRKKKALNAEKKSSSSKNSSENKSVSSNIESRIQDVQSKISTLTSNYESQMSTLRNNLTTMINNAIQAAEAAAKAAANQQTGVVQTGTTTTTATGAQTGTYTVGNHNWQFDFTETLTDSQKSDLEAFKKIYTENIDKYKAVESATGVPAELVAAIHWSESGCNFDTYLHNGDPLGSPTVHVPEGIFFEKGQWTEAAIDAIKSIGMSVDPNDINSIYDYAERYNGLGYRNKGLASPYVWSGTSKYTGGKYVADGVFDPDAFDQTIGVAVMLKALST